jgi:uncharacterized membrane protein
MMPKNRLEAFSDGVIAVAITVLALNLPIPAAIHGRDLAATLGHRWPTFAAFAVSFLTIGIVWVNHHAMLRRLARVDHAVLFGNLLLLMSICLVPFSTALFAEYLTASHGAHLAAAIYGGSLLVMSCCFFGLQRHVLVRRPELLHEGISAEDRRKVLKRNRFGLLPYAVATAAAALSGYVTYAITVVIAIYYALPRTTADVAEGDPAAGGG